MPFSFLYNINFAKNTLPIMTRIKFLGGTTMLVIAFIAVFIVGAIAGIAGEVLFAKHIMNMTLDEMSQCGNMLIAAGNNRESVIELTIDNDGGFDYESIRLEKR